MSGNGGQKNLEELKKPVHVIVTKDFAPNDRLWIHPFVPHFPSPPPAGAVLTLCILMHMLFQEVEYELILQSACPKMF